MTASGLIIRVCIGVFIGIMEKRMETTIIYWGNIGVIWGLYRDNGKGNGNYYSILGNFAARFQSGISSTAGVRTSTNLRDM